MSTPPAGFSKELFEELIIRLNWFNKPNIREQLLKLAEQAGGAKLRAAGDVTSFPPCSRDEQCLDCWVKPYCIHSFTPEELRRQLWAAEDVLTEPNQDPAITELVTITASLDKTNINNIRHLVYMVFSIMHSLNKSEAIDAPNAITE